MNFTLKLSFFFDIERADIDFKLSFGSVELSGGLGGLMSLAFGNSSDTFGTRGFFDAIDS